MPATASQLRRPIIVDHTVDFGDGVTVQFRYDRNKLTEAWMNAWTRAEQAADGASRLNDMLDDLIDGWDIRNDDGSECPKTSEAIGFLFSVPDKARIFSELLTATGPARAEGNASAPTSATPGPTSTTPPVTPLNGQPPSPSPEPLASPSTT